VQYTCTQRHIKNSKKKDNDINFYLPNAKALCSGGRLVASC